MAKVRIGVAGFGAIGRHHARNLALMPEVSFVGVAESDQTVRAEAERLGYPVFSSLEQLFSIGVQGVVLSIPTSSHFEYAMRCIDQQCGVLV